MRESITIG
jgi:hypothetical protein